jgi:hypothetical protein
LGDHVLGGPSTRWAPHLFHFLVGNLWLGIIPRLNLVSAIVEILSLGWLALSISSVEIWDGHIC